ncbi:hypothetical protein K431DRAFT_282187 [Polychaeton citri CBS 116435]|uniref:Uncharacterized protein n=1 Tax=Polychaeton citri CBS 116435 TaxID=1314669 RepID=A0A9P4QEU8_9PEZI|nr:hypothetical protein K431DRAFT_282187 [Polychaeton citri CBS 116435]
MASGTLPSPQRPQQPYASSSTYFTPREEPNDPQTAPGPESPNRWSAGTEPFPEADDQDIEENPQISDQKSPQKKRNIPDEMHHQQRNMMKPIESFDIEDEYPPKEHWGLPLLWENIIFYLFAAPAWALEIAAAAIGSYLRSDSIAFIVTVTLFCVFHWAAWIQTAIAMIQRCSWYRDSEQQMEEHRQFFFFSVRLQRLMLPTAVIALPTFIAAYVQRYSENDVAYWLLFLLFFIIDTVGCVVNAYNNITWEADILAYEEGIYPIKGSRFAILGL